MSRSKGRPDEKKPGSWKVPVITAIVAIVTVLSLAEIAPWIPTKWHKAFYMVLGAGGGVSCLVLLFYARVGYDRYRLLRRPEKADVFQTAAQIVGGNALVIASLVFILMCIACLIFFGVFELLPGVPERSLEEQFELRIGAAFNWALAAFLTLIGLAVSALAMHYAFRAEHSAEEARKNSESLLHERSSYLTGFQHLLARTNSLLDPSDASRAEVWRLLAERSTHVEIKCMFLTPFMGHAGLIDKNTGPYQYPEKPRSRAAMDLNEDAFHRFESLRKNLLAVARHDYGHVKMITLTPQALAQWYAEVLVLNASYDWSSECPKRFGESNYWEAALQEAHAILERKLGRDCIRVPVKKEVGGETKQVDEQVLHLNGLLENLAGDLSEAGDHHQIRKLEALPFQFLLIYPVTKEGDKSPQGRTDALITFVGSNTYHEILTRLRNPQDTAVGSYSIFDLLHGLHSCYHSEDKAFCEMLNQHFENYWAAACEVESPKALAVQVPTLDTLKQMTTLLSTNAATPLETPGEGAAPLTPVATPVELGQQSESESSQPVSPQGAEHGTQEKTPATPPVVSAQSNGEPTGQAGPQVAATEPPDSKATTADPPSSTDSEGDPTNGTA
jgi:hypothetical protein